MGKIVESSRMLEALCCEGKLMGTEPETRENSVEGELGVKPDRVDFRRVVMREAEGKLAELSMLPSIHKLVL